MSNKRYYILVLLVVLNFGIAADRSLYILHTNNTNGALENCYCPDHPLGAIEKRAAFVETWLEKHPNTIVVDAGDLIPLINDAIKDSLACLAYRHIPYDAILPGDQEIIRGRDRFEKLLNLTSAPIINTNLKNPKISGSKPVMIVKRSDLRIALLGIIGPAAIKYYPEAVNSAIKLDDVDVVLKNQLKELAEKADITILLTHQGYDHDVKLAANVTDIDVIIGAHSQTSLKTAQEVNNILVAQAGKEGYYVGVIEIKFDEQNRIISKSGYLEPMKLDMPDHPQVMKIIEEYEQKTGIINRRKDK